MAVASGRADPRRDGLEPFSAGGRPARRALAGGDGAVHPPELTETLAALRLNPNELLAEHILPFVPRAAEIDQEQDRRSPACGKILAECTSVNAVATWLMQSRPWDFMAVYFDAIDHFCHALHALSSAAAGAHRRARLRAVSRRRRGRLPIPRHDAQHARGNGGAGDDGDSHVGSRLSSRSLAAASRIPAEPAGPAFEHRDFGIFVMAGPGIEHDKLLHGVNLLDVTPTLLALFGLPVGAGHGRPADSRSVSRSAGGRDDSRVGMMCRARPGCIRRTCSSIRVESHEAIQQLVALGYIEPPPANRQQAIDNTVRELRYNLARSYMDDGRHGAAAEILEELYDRWPNEHRFGVQLAACYQALERIADLRSVVEDLATRRQADADAARQELREFADASPRSTSGRRNGQELTRSPTRSGCESAPCAAALATIRGRSTTCGAACRWRRAITSGRSSISSRPNKSTPSGPGSCCKSAKRTCDCGRRSGPSKLSSGRPRSIRTIRTSYLGFCRVHMLRHEYCRRGRGGAARRSVLRYQLPMAHFLLGKSLFRLGRTLQAVEALHVALSINPHFAEAHRLLAIIYRRRLGDFEQAAEASAARARNAHCAARRTGGETAIPIDVEAGRIGGRESELLSEPQASLNRRSAQRSLDLSQPARKLRRRARLRSSIVQRSAAERHVDGHADAGRRRNGDSRRRPPRSGREQSPRLFRIRTREESPQRQFVAR